MSVRRWVSSVVAVVAALGVAGAVGGGHVQGVQVPEDSWEDAANNELHTRREPLMKAITRLRLEEEALRQEYGVTDQDEPADQKAEG